MNHYSLQIIANKQLAERRAEADRARLARSGQRAGAGSHERPRTHPARRTGGVLGSLFGRVAHS